MNAPFYSRKELDARSMIDVAIRFAIKTALVSADGKEEFDDVFGSGSVRVDGVGEIRVQCRKEWVERRRGAKIRRRFRFSIDGRQVTTRVLYEKVRSLT